MSAGHVYLARNLDDGLYKVGFAKDPHYRIQLLRSRIHARVALVSFASTPQAERLERIAHQCFRAWRVRGEWFSLGAAQVARFWPMITAEARRQGVEVSRPAWGILAPLSDIAGRLRRPRSERRAYHLAKSMAFEAVAFMQAMELSHAPRRGGLPQRGRPRKEAPQEAPPAAQEGAKKKRGKGKGAK